MHPAPHATVAYRVNRVVRARSDGTGPRATPTAILDSSRCSGKVVLETAQPGRGAGALQAPQDHLSKQVRMWLLASEAHKGLDLLRDEGLVLCGQVQQQGDQDTAGSARHADGWNAGGRRWPVSDADVAVRAVRRVRCCPSGAPKHRGVAACAREMRNLALVAGLADELTMVRPRRRRCRQACEAL